MSTLLYLQSSGSIRTGSLQPIRLLKASLWCRGKTESLETSLAPIPSHSHTSKVTLKCWVSLLRSVRVLAIQKFSVKLFHFVSMWIETLRTVGDSGLRLIRHISELLQNVTGEKRCTSLVMQRLRVAIQKGKLRGNFLLVIRCPFCCVLEALMRCKSIFLS